MLRPLPRFRPETLFRPRSVAVLGGESAAGRTVLGNLERAGFKGEIHVLGGPDQAATLADAPELGVVADGDLQTGVDALAARGAGVVVAVAPGEVRRSACRVIGPNSFGVMVPGAGLDASLGHLPARPGKLALISPSTSLCRTVLDWAEPNGVGFSHVVGIGLEADLDAASVLDVLSREPGTGAILLDIRAVRDRRALLSATRAASRLRPVVALHAGGRQGDPSGHDDAVFEAALRRAGAVRVTTLDELLASAGILTRARPPRSERLMIVSNAISAGQLAADEAVRQGIPLARPDPAAEILLRMQLPPQPPDVGLIWTGDENPTRPAEAAAMLSALPEVGGIAAILAPTGEADAAGIAALAACQPGLRLPLLACVLGETTAAPHRRTLAEAGVPVFASPEQAVRGFAQLVRQRRAREAVRELPSSRVLRLQPDLRAARAVLDGARRDGRAALFQDEALAVLSAYGMPVLPFRAVAGPEEAADAASLLGFPAAVKRRRLHPDEAGALALDLPSADDVRGAAGRLGAEHGLLVQRQAGRTQRLRITVADDALFGPAIGFGPGGRDRVHDTVFDLPPLNLPLAAALVARSPAAQLLAEGQAHAAADLDAVADALVRVSQIVIDLPELGSLSIDPLFADENGVSVAEAFMTLRPPGEAASLAITPYPAHLVEHWTAAGQELEVRPIRPEDAQAHEALFRRLSPEDVRYRFFALLRELSAEQIARMTQIDYDREMAMVAVRGATTVGVARLVREPGGSQAEFAIVVDPAMKGRGVGRHLMERIISWGRAQRLGTISGQILAENAPMLAFIRRLGFEVRRIPGEGEVVEARLAL